MLNWKRLESLGQQGDGQPWTGCFKSSHWLFFLRDSKKGFSKSQSRIQKIQIAQCHLEICYYVVCLNAHGGGHSPKEGGLGGSLPRHPWLLWEWLKALTVYWEPVEYTDEKKKPRCYVRFTQYHTLCDTWAFLIQSNSHNKVSKSNRVLSVLPSMPHLHPMKQQPANFSVNVSKTRAKSVAFNQFNWCWAIVAQLTLIKVSRLQWTLGPCPSSSSSPPSHLWESSHIQEMHCKKFKATLVIS